MRPPSVDAVARGLADIDLPHPLLVDAARAAIAAGDPDSARARATETAATLLRGVINATGVMLHTNLGRAPLPAGGGGGGPRWRYSNLELDLATGRRGSRRNHAASLLARACGAEAALVVNNNAGAVLLTLAALARDRAVLVSRGELVEIGGGFRIPDVMAQSGARLVEVGTTNRTRLADYAAALDATGEAETGLVLQVHRSNYRIVGFTEDATTAQLATLGVPVVADIGSGLIDADTPWLPGPPPGWLAAEPAARQTLEAGAALVTFSGDKLLGGPQAGVIAGRRDLVEACARHPLNRALRPGGLVLAALQDAALAYLGRDVTRIAFWAMAATPVVDLRRRAEAVAARCGARVIDTIAVAGGGSVPGQDIPSAGVAVAGDLAGALRRGDPPVLARVHDEETVLDLRTVDPADDDVVAEALSAARG